MIRLPRKVGRVVWNIKLVFISTIFNEDGGFWFSGGSRLVFGLDLGVRCC